MITIQGKGVSKGIARGPLCFFRRREAVVTKKAAGPWEEELARLTAAQTDSAVQLAELAERCRGLEGDAAILFETHAMFVEDEDFTDCMHALVKEEGCTAEYAVQRAGEQFSAMFSAMDDPYMQARAADIRDIARRILDNLTGTIPQNMEGMGSVILAADDLAPSETVQLERSRILGFITREGSGSSHTAILARTMGIPAICGLGEGLRDDYQGRLCYIDGETGEVILEPDAAARTLLEEKLTRQQEQRRLLEAMRGQEDVTLDGRKIAVCCNIGAPEDVAAVLHNDGRGIGLFRSEFLYLRAGDYPGEEEQFRAYRAVAEAMGDRRVVIRTLDIGADKQVGYFGMRKEENPALGVRGVRLCLNRPEVFRTQLRALYRASAHGRVAIMFPMIASVWEVEACKRLCREVMAELERQGIPYDRETKIGVMLETPASVLVADALAREVDFFSVGTNDLTQYTLACDRQSNDLGRFFDPRHPAVLRALNMAAEAAHAAGIWIGICGELAADTDLLPAFLAMGIDELSVSPSSVLPLRAAIRGSVAGSCTPEKQDC